MHGHMQATMQAMHEVGITWKYILTPSRTLQGCNGKALLCQAVIDGEFIFKHVSFKIVICFEIIV